MRLNTTIEDDYGKGECHYRSAPSSHPAPFAAGIGTAGGDGEIIESASRDGALRINHAHEELMGMGEHSS